MKRVLIALASLTVFAGLVVWGQGPDDDYLRAYKLIQDADQLNATGQQKIANEKYREARSILRGLNSSHPKWNEEIVTFRLKYVIEKVGSADSKAAPAQPARPGTPEKAEPITMPAIIQEELRTLTVQVQQLAAEKQTLESKLREALIAQPAAVDPRELEKAEQRIATLEKERELLKVALQKEQTRAQKVVDARAAQEERKETKELKQRLKSQEQAFNALKGERDQVAGKLEVASADAARLKSVRSENDDLRKQLAEAQRSAAAAASSSAGAKQLENELASARDAAKAGQARASRAEQTSKDLEKQLAAAKSDAAKTASAADAMQRLQKDRDELARRVTELTADVQSAKRRTETPKSDAPSDQVALLRARLEVFEARKVPYTPEELALLKEPQLAARTEATAAARPERKKPRELPAAARTVVAEAERAYNARRYPEAEQKFQQALQFDNKNTALLGNLAAAQLEQGRLDQAQATLTQALAEDPNDPRAMSLMGIVQFRRGKFDDALTQLSRAAQFDPKDAETQNYLGITLSQLGQRLAAETALRKAIQLAPGYPGAHNNLAVIYATQQPPMIELAKWHYQKALANGHASNAELEKLLESKNGSAAKAP